MVLIQESKVKEDCIINSKIRMWKEANFQWQESDGALSGLMTL